MENTDEEWFTDGSNFVKKMKLKKARYVIVSLNGVTNALPPSIRSQPFRAFKLPEIH